MPPKKKKQVQACSQPSMPIDIESPQHPVLPHVAAPPVAQPIEPALVPMLQPKITRSRAQSTQASPREPTMVLTDPDPKSLPTQVNATVTAANLKQKEVVQSNVDDGSTTAVHRMAQPVPVVNCLLPHGLLIWMHNKSLDSKENFDLDMSTDSSDSDSEPPPQQGKTVQNHSHPHNPPPQSHDAQQSPVPTSTTSQAICDGNCDCALLTGSELDRDMELDDKNIKFTQERFKEALINFIVADDQSLNVIECYEFRNLLLLLRKDLLQSDIPKQMKLHEMILVSWKQHMDVLRVDLSHLEGAISVMADIWSDRNQ
ncbi:hypothetical protein EDC04DRAFT_2917029 [Pisolithus marmoratus]|nr:hypothetical protein EDC04DRAFT_2917029 [Pisolithus marmoratus]